MPLFFFHLYDDIVSLDEEGQELEDADAARQKGVETAREMACTEVRRGHLYLGHRVDVEDEGGVTIATVHFRDVVKIEA